MPVVKGEGRRGALQVERIVLPVEVDPPDREEDEDGQHEGGRHCDVLPAREEALPEEDDHEEPVALQEVVPVDGDHVLHGLPGEDGHQELQGHAEDPELDLRSDLLKTKGDPPGEDPQDHTRGFEPDVGPVGSDVPVGPEPRQEHPEVHEDVREDQCPGVPVVELLDAFG